MADLSRERIAELRIASEICAEYELKHAVPPEQIHATVSLRELRALLSMAERSVSQETVRKLAEYVAIAAEPTNAREKERLWAWTAFSHDACRDLRPAAARLAAKGGEGG